MTLKMIHTSDWHLGKKLFKKDRLEEQKFFLEWLEAHIKKNNINCLLISGDIFDTPTPPHQAQQVYFDFLEKVSQLNCSTYIIGGNHDSSILLDSPSVFLQKHNIHVWGGLNPDWTKHSRVIEHDNHKTQIITLPYFRNFEIEQWRRKYKVESADDENSTLKIIKTFIEQNFDDSCDYHILMAHHLFGQFSESGSEQSVSLSGISSLPIDLFKDFDYLALGHIHKKQQLSQERPIAMYCGSPIAFRFSETTTKQLSQLSLSENFDYQLIEVPQMYKIKTIKTDQQNILKDVTQYRAEIGDETKVLLEIRAKMQEPQSGLIDEIRELIVGSQIELMSFYPQFNSIIDSEDSIDQIQDLSLEELFEKYYCERYEVASIPQSIAQDFNELLQEITDNLLENREGP